MLRNADESRFGLLFIGLVALLVIEPLGDTLWGRADDRVFMVALAVLMLVGVWGIASSSPWRRLGRVLVGAGVACGVAATVWPNAALRTATPVFAGAFLSMTIAVGLRTVFAGGPVGPNHLLGAASVYLMLGVLWALAYRILHQVAPGAFAGIPAASGSTYLYLSFVTLATLGYGDVTPVTPIARTLCYLEAVAGQLYVALLVAILVSRHAASGSGR